MPNMTDSSGSGHCYLVGQQQLSTVHLVQALLLRSECVCKHSRLLSRRLSAVLQPLQQSPEKLLRKLPPMLMREAAIPSDSARLLEQWLSPLLVSLFALKNLSHTSICLTPLPIWSVLHPFDCGKPPVRYTLGLTPHRPLSEVIAPLRCCLRTAASGCLWV